MAAPAPPTAPTHRDQAHFPAREPSPPPPRRPAAVSAATPTNPPPPTRPIAAAGRPVPGASSGSGGSGGPTAISSSEAQARIHALRQQRLQQQQLQQQQQQPKPVAASSADPSETIPSRPPPSRPPPPRVRRGGPTIPGVDNSVSSSPSIEPTSQGYSGPSTSVSSTRYPLPNSAKPTAGAGIPARPKSPFSAVTPARPAPPYTPINNNNNNKYGEQQQQQQQYQGEPLQQKSSTPPTSRSRRYNPVPMTAAVSSSTESLSRSKSLEDSSAPPNQPPLQASISLEESTRRMRMDEQPLVGSRGYGSSREVPGLRGETSSSYRTEGLSSSSRNELPPTSSSRGDPSAGMHPDT